MWLNSTLEHQLWSFGRFNRRLYIPTLSFLSRPYFAESALDLTFTWKPFLNFGNNHLSSWGSENFQIQQVLAPLWLTVLPTIYVSPFACTISSKKKPFGTFNNLLGNLLSSFDICSTFHVTAGDNAVNLSPTIEPRSPFLQFPKIYLSFPCKSSLRVLKT